jgi:hypothetical protein
LPKVIKSGIFSKEKNFPLKPPAGIIEQCKFCYATLETVEDEPVSEFTVIRDRKSGYKVPGWKITCPECQKKVTIPWPEVPAEVYRLLNTGAENQLLTN